MEFRWKHWIICYYYLKIIRKEVLLLIIKFIKILLLKFMNILYFTQIYSNCFWLFTYIFQRLPSKSVEDLFLCLRT